jgi:Kef-type K+ transport system membrane component KefB
MLLINEFDSIDKLFFTLGIVLTLTNLIYRLMAKFGRPLVLGGITAGVIIQHLNLPTKYFDIHAISGLGQMGIVMFMMLVGNQLNFKNLLIRKRYMPITLINMLIPFILGFIFAGLLVHNHVPWLNGQFLSFYNTSITDSHLNLMFEIFVGLAVSMTAFPVLSMFLKHTHLVNTNVGSLALLCGFVDEIFLWVILGVILISSQQNEIISSFAPIDFIAYLIFIIGIAPKLLTYVVPRIKRESTMLGFLIIGCFASAALADSVNLHQIFGAFLFGLILPRNNEMIVGLRKNLFLLINTILLPIYFVETGVAANIVISFNYTTILMIVIFTLIALIGKFGGSFITGKFMGMSNDESTMLGSLLNMRGIIEIILLNVGLDIGIINNKIYTILLTMAMICTFFATSLSLYLRKKLALSKIQE